MLLLLLYRNNPMVQTYVVLQVMMMMVKISFGALPVYFEVITENINCSTPGETTLLLFPVVAVITL